MTSAEIDAIRNQIALMRSIQRTTVHLPIATVEQLMSKGHRAKAGSKITSGLADAVAHARIDRLWRETKKAEGSEITQYDWGYKDGLEAAKALFGSEQEVMATRIGPVDKKALAKGKIKTVDKAPVNVKRGRKPKADRAEARLRANREAKRK